MNQLPKKVLIIHKENSSGIKENTTMSNVLMATEKNAIEIDKYGVLCTKDAVTLSSFLGVLTKISPYALIIIPN